MYKIFKENVVRFLEIKDMNFQVDGEHQVPWVKADLGSGPGTC